jgi:hypothetical protein
MLFVKNQQKSYLNLKKNAIAIVSGLLLAFLARN